MKIETLKNIKDGGGVSDDDGGVIANTEDADTRKLLMNVGRN
jgi:hypothetical protein